ncbi:hypothetical protein [Mesobacillus foraminis]|uniref:hypothetical protein n=1 Tax=Mesobacillus foraminis TaxID=279826 RepID=UPI000EF4476E|nr:hypothetical protein [Mesobacillus foraminis]
MTTILLLLSFLLNIVIIFAIIVLYLRQNRLLQSEKRQEKIISEFEELFSGYLFEMKEENDQFLKKMNSFDSKDGKKETKEPVPKKGKVSYRMVQDAYAPKQQQEALFENGGGGEEHVPESKGKNAAGKSSLLNRIQDLKREGDSIDEIAKKLGKGKTEIELLLKFQKN